MDTLPPSNPNVSVSYHRAPVGAAAVVDEAPDPPRHGVQLALVGGYGGVSSDTTREYQSSEKEALLFAARQQFGWGAGVRAGYVFDAQIYVGAAYTLHARDAFGYATYDFAPSGGGDTTTRKRGSSWLEYRGVEVGYEVYVGRLTVRPYVGAGQLLLHARPAGQPAWPADRGAVAWLGAVGFYSLTPAVLAGVELRGTRVFDGWQSSAAVFATVAYRFALGGGL